MLKNIGSLKNRVGRARETKDYGLNRHYTIGMVTDPGMKRPASSPANKEDKKMTDQCLVCLEPATDDVYECAWCEGHQHSQCTKISVDQCNVLSGLVKNIVFFCSTCLQSLPHALQSYDYHGFVDSRLESMENRLSALFTGDKLPQPQPVIQQECISKQIDNLSLKIADLSAKQQSLQQCVQTVTSKIEESASHMETDLPLSTPVTSSGAFDVIDEMADKDRRKTILWCIIFQSLLTEILISSLLRPM